MPSFVAEANTGLDAFVSVRSVTKPGGVVSGDVGVFCLAQWESGGSFPAVTPPTGAVLRGTVATSSIRTLCYLLKIDAETSFSFSWTGARWSALSAHFFTDVDPALDLSTVPFDSATGSSTPISTLTVTTVDTAGLTWHVNNLNSAGGTTHTTPTDFTQTVDVSSWASAYRISPGDGSQSAAGATFTPSDIWAALLVSLEPAESAVDKSDSDTATLVDSGSITATFTNAEAVTAIDVGTIYLFDNDSVSIADDQSTDATVSSSDSGSFTDSQNLSATFTGTDSISLLDSGSATNEFELTLTASEPYSDMYFVPNTRFQLVFNLRSYTEEV